MEILNEKKISYKKLFVLQHQNTESKTEPKHKTKNPVPSSDAENTNDHQAQSGPTGNGLLPRLPRFAKLRREKRTSAEINKKPTLDGLNHEVVNRTPKILEPDDPPWRRPRRFCEGHRKPDFLERSPSQPRGDVAVPENKIRGEKNIECRLRRNSCDP